MKKALLSLILLTFSLIFSQEWSRNGPFSAHVISLAIAPSDTSVIYAGTYCDGVYKSIDGAENWIHCSIESLPVWEDSLDNSPSVPCWWYGDYYPVQAISIDPINAEHLWIGTSGKGLFDSNDGGNSWQQASETLPDSLDVDYIHINENNPDELFIGAGNHNYGYLPLENGGLYHTIDGGNNWSLIENVPHGDYYHITGICNEPGNEEHLYTGISSGGEPGFSWGLMESIDGGNEWQIINDVFTFYDLSINPANNQNMWSIIYTGYMDWLLAFSTDGGYNWTPYPDWNPEIWCTSMYADSEYNLYVAEGGTSMYGNVKKSSDNGNTWTNIDTMCAGRGINLRNRCEENRENVNKIYFGTYCGIYRSDNGGSTCLLKNSNLPNSYIKEIELHPDDSDIVYAGGFQGLWKSIDGGDSWNQVNEEYVNVIKYDYQHPDTLYYGGQNLMRSFDNGISFTDISHNINGIIVDISINHNYNNIVYIVTVYYDYLVYKTDDYGINWDLIFSVESANYPKVTIDSNYPDTLYFSDYRSTDGGSTWEYLSLTPGEVVNIHPQNSNTIYYSDRNTLIVSYDWGETFHDLDTYQNWTTPVPAIGNLVFDRHDSDKMFYCTPNNGIHYSIDAGENWSVLEGTYEKRTSDFIPFLEENKVYIASHGDGVWIGENISVSTDEECEIENVKCKISNYPNPFNPRTNINFNLSQSGKISLSVYNIKGQLVIKLIDNETFQKGSHSVNWNGKNYNGKEVSTNVYLYTLQVGDKSISRKMLMVK
ncbi:MAG: T9SS type A sorting domain-containing protein [Candidatus Stygibacter australis]|nr:T9SS type A sorting domain-containing protein [Candidatus Stygibacter australis]MDP8321475.1 T9SS type A sorting domain-containing protein [Candidatus Stygibacter australis]